MTLVTCRTLIDPAAGNAVPCDSITLDETARHRRRAKLISDGGTEFLLDLPHARLLRQGDGLLLDDGRIIKVHAAPEDLVAVRGRDRRHLLALAWQIGNRHLAAQIDEHRILIRRDPVIEAMLTGLGAELDFLEAAFNPEGGAYDAPAAGHSHSHAHPHTHSHAEEHPHERDA
ncbi:urease accessory protein UreE [Pseudohoeflea coraliihabitans]|uniref:Urease accessory protein UreE n=1 Tax=Pseudohoeflea coraliihabitans TaxID=2860393 RepID=A0ABS6WKC5_9HYPH|nr:urease accessory protein UreE [Pseudohoeflea sp. DP4N28-3]MBW3096230.1 urease accessory protein UreE [Pseudohoeflea sp. DP4N28-3]